MRLDALDSRPSRGAIGPSMQVRVFHAVRIGLGFTLLLAALLKIHQFATDPAAFGITAGIESLGLLAIASELVLGWWLLSGIAIGASWVASIVCCFVFFTMACFQFFHGETSCGCFGVFEIHPRYTLAMDSGILIMLVLFPPPRVVGTDSARLAQLAPAVLVVLSAGVLVWSAGTPEPRARFRTDANHVAVGQLSVLVPEKWIGENFPLLNHTDIGARLRRGSWFVVLHKEDCDQCAELLQDYREYGCEVFGMNRDYPVALLGLDAGVTGERRDPTGDLLTGTLDHSKRWFVRTPTVLLLDEGKVVDVRQEFTAFHDQSFSRS